MIFTVAKHHRHEHHRHEHHQNHAHHQKDEPHSKLRKLVVPITLIVILVYAARWAVSVTNLAAGIAIAAAAASLWILHPRKGR
jgi:heme/copper-type cytochrome/quinol oxidase subunit 4